MNQPSNLHTFQFLSDARVIQEFSGCPFVLDQRNHRSPIFIRIYGILMMDGTLCNQNILSANHLQNQNIQGAATRVHHSSALSGQPARHVWSAGLLDVPTALDMVVWEMLSPRDKTVQVEQLKAAKNQSKSFVRWGMVSNCFANFSRPFTKVRIHFSQELLQQCPLDQQGFARHWLQLSVCKDIRSHVPILEAIMPWWDFEQV